MRNSKLRLGVLLPASNFVPFLADDLLTALQFGLEDTQLEAETIVEFAGYNADAKSVLPKIQQLLSGRRVDGILAPLNPALIAKVATQFESSRVPLIALNLGEDPLYEGVGNPYVLINSFHLWQTAWMCGYLGARRFGPRGAAMVGLHEGGYGMTFAFQLGLEAGDGGLVRMAVTHQNSSTEDPSPSIAEAAAVKPDFIWGAYSGKEAISFLGAYEASGFKQNIPLIGLPLLVDEHIRSTAGSTAQGVHFVTSGQQSDESGALRAALAQAIGRAPNPYAELAYESAHLVASAVRSTSTPGGASVDLAEALRRSDFRGPRGLTHFDDGGEIEISFCLRQVTPGGDSITKVETPSLLQEQYQLARKLVKQGWDNPYLCA